MTERLITHLRHIDLAVPDHDKQLDFYSGVWGLTKVVEDSGISFLAAEGSPEQYVIRLRKADEKRSAKGEIGKRRADAGHRKTLTNSHTSIVVRLCGR